MAMIFAHSKMFGYNSFSARENVYRKLGLETPAQYRYYLRLQRHGDLLGAELFRQQIVTAYKRQREEHANKLE
jgi:hypothetical protein